MFHGCTFCFYYCGCFLVLKLILCYVFFFLMILLFLSFSMKHFFYFMLRLLGFIDELNGNEHSFLCLFFHCHKMVVLNVDILECNPCFVVVSTIHCYYIFKCSITLCFCCSSFADLLIFYNTMVYSIRFFITIIY
jgi:hypothetical protein